jgi:hypothetical protein
MRASIGNIANELWKYSNLIQINTVKDLPFLRAYISGSSGRSTKCFIYIIQELSGKYSICSYHNDTNGDKVIATGSYNRPFELEKYSGKNIDIADLNIKKHISFDDVMEYIYSTLYSYNLICFDTSKIVKLSEVLIHKQRVCRILSKILKENNCDETIYGLVDMVCIKGIPVVLKNIKSQEIKYLKSQLSKQGLSLCIEDNKITDIKFNGGKYNVVESKEV